MPITKPCVCVTLPEHGYKQKWHIPAIEMYNKKLHNQLLVQYHPVMHPGVLLVN
jgi:hypothetical protein